ncbi:MAG: type 2 isopentenyl-diphosphate Delta-isomerase [Candidatus Pacebacteria bacterium]|nr:type 2 isopentenyl-diphosphate Delta-isomerase [Candidatus Paceibacterota bacterium]
MSIKARKIDHIKICLDKDVQFNKKNGFERYELKHNALADFDFNDIDISGNFLGFEFQVPLIISSITGGCNEAEKINKNLAKVAQRLSIAMSCGSQKAMIKDEKLSHSYLVRDVAPDIFYIGNIGLDYLNNIDNFDRIRIALTKIKAKAIFIHLNLAQELVQGEGERNFANSRENLEHFIKFIDMPVLVKEVGFGISGEIALELEKCNVVAIDIAGAGGTSWTKVEKYRQKDHRLAKRFAQWGIPSAESLVQCRSAVKLPIIASGGIYDGITACKAIALGADLIGMAGPLLKEANKSSQALEEYLENFILELKTAMMLVGVKNLKELKNNEKIIKLYPFV